MTSQAYQRALAFLDEAVAVLDDCTIRTDPGQGECARPTRAASTRSGASRDREHDRGADRQGFRPW